MSLVSSEAGEPFDVEYVVRQPTGELERVVIGAGDVLVVSRECQVESFTYLIDHKERLRGM